MKLVDIGGTEYRMFTFASIHDDDQTVECQEAESGKLVCEIRIPPTGPRYFARVSEGLNVDAVKTLIEYLEEQFPLPPGSGRQI